MPSYAPPSIMMHSRFRRGQPVDDVQVSRWAAHHAPLYHRSSTTIRRHCRRTVHPTDSLRCHGLAFSFPPDPTLSMADGGSWPNLPFRIDGHWRQGGVEFPSKFPSIAKTPIFTCQDCGRVPRTGELRWRSHRCSSGRWGLEQGELKETIATY